MVAKAQKSLWKSAWKLLLEGQNSPKLPYGTPVVSTVSATGIPYSRVMVLRGASKVEGELLCYTDRRSLKVSHLKQGGGFMAWTFWSPTQQLQFSCSGPTTELPERVCRKTFLDLPKHSRKAYAALSRPGTRLTEPSDGLPDDWTDRPMNQTDYAEVNFLVLKTKITRAEILQLNREGNRRLLVERNVQENWDFQWLVP